jgi:hypothetical protein
MVEDLTRRIKKGAFPIISDVEGFTVHHVGQTGHNGTIASCIRMLVNHISVRDQNHE